MHIDYPGGRDWASVYWQATSVGATRSHMNFSRFTKLQLGLTLDSEWQSYEIDLAEFEPNDLSRLHVVLGFLIFPAQHPLAFSVRNAHYD